MSKRAKPISGVETNDSARQALVVPAGVNVHKCPHCDHSPFKSRAGLANHVKHKHGGDRKITMSLDNFEELLAISLRNIQSLQDPAARNIIRRGEDDDIKIRLATGLLARSKLERMKRLHEIASEVDEAIIGNLRANGGLKSKSLDELMDSARTINTVMAMEAKQVNDLLGAKDKLKDYVSQLLTSMTRLIGSTEDQEQVQSDLQDALQLPMEIGVRGREKLRRLFAKVGIGDHYEPPKVDDDGAK